MTQKEQVLKLLRGGVKNGSDIRKELKIKYPASVISALRAQGCEIETTDDGYKLLTGVETEVFENKGGDEELIQGGDYSVEEIEALNSPLNKAFVLSRDFPSTDSEGNPSTISLDYLAGYIVIQTANDIFKFEWNSEITGRPELHELGSYAWFDATVKTTIRGFSHEDVGFAEVAFEGERPVINTALKGCVTDAVKRSLRYWGERFGLSLYDAEGLLDPENKKDVKKLPMTLEEASGQFMQKILDCKSAKELKALVEKIQKREMSDSARELIEMSSNAKMESLLKPVQKTKKKSKSKTKKLSC